MIDIEEFDSPESPVEPVNGSVDELPVKELSAIDIMINQATQRSINRILYARDWLEIVNKCSSHSDRLIVYEQAISKIPQSWKVWRSYLSYTRQHAEQYPIHHPIYQSTNQLHERCLLLLSRIPRVWQDYSSFLIKQCMFTRSRQTLDRALSVLPITQHALWIWPTINQSVRQSNCLDVIAHMLKRQAHADPLKREELIDYLIDTQRHNEACHCLIDCMVDGSFVSHKGRSVYDLFEMFLSIVMHHGASIDQTIDVEAILNQSINQFPEAAGRCQTALAAYFLRRSLIEKARATFEQSINHSRTIKDFVLIFNAYTKFLESLVNQSVNQSVNQPSPENDAAADLAMERLDRLIDSRPLLINACYLRQNPNNIDRWIERVSIYQSLNQPVNMIQTLSKAVATVDIGHCNGTRPLSHLWLMLASIYLSNNDIQSARTIWTSAANQPFHRVSDLVDVITAHAEAELMHGHIDETRTLLERYCAAKPSVQSTAHSRVGRSVLLWSLLADVEENHGSLETVRGVFDSILKHGICTVRLSIHHAHWLRGLSRWEESFRWSERCLASLTSSPEAAARIWLDYLRAIWTRTFKLQSQKQSSSSKLTIHRERMRDLFESCFKQMSLLMSNGSALGLKLALLWASWEQQYGTHRRCLSVLSQTVNQCNQSIKFVPSLVYVSSAQRFYGRQRTREAFTECSEGLLDVQTSLLLCLYADWECKCGELERARALYRNAASCYDPRILQSNKHSNKPSNNPWSRWSEFEVEYGNEVTYREMLRIKRAVTQLFSTRIKIIDQAESQANIRSIEQIFRDSLSLKDIVGDINKPARQQFLSPSVSESTVHPDRAHLVQEDHDVSVDDQPMDQSSNQSDLKNPDEIEIDDMDD